MRATIAMLVTCASGTLLFGCAKGRTPPDPTAMVAVTDGATLEYTFGSSDYCLGESVKPAADMCTNSSESIPAVWPTMKVKLKPFRIDSREVTNLQYLYCVEMGKCSEPKAGNAGDPKSADSIQHYYGDADNPYNDYPVVHVTQQQAREYCAFVGKRLPTEYEWEAVARLAHKKIFGDATTKLSEACKNKEVAIKGCNTAYPLPQAAGVRIDDKAQVPGGTQDVSDLIGNVSEWVEAGFVQNITCKAAMSDASLGKCCSARDKCAEDKKDKCSSDLYPDCQTCDACADPAKGCFGQCVDAGDAKKATFWQCIGFGDAAQENPAVGKSATAMFRGASYGTAAGSMCEARAVDRSNKTQLSDNKISSPYVGFRCVADQ